MTNPRLLAACTFVCLICRYNSIGAQDQDVPKFVHASDFYHHVEELAEELDLSSDQLSKFRSLKNAFNENLDELSKLRKADVEPKLQALSRSERYRVMLERMNERLAQDYYDVLATDQQRMGAVQYVLRSNLRANAFPEFLKRAYVRNTLKLTDDTVLNSGEREEVTSTDSNDSILWIAELDKQLRKEVLSVLPKDDFAKFAPYLPESQPSNGPLTAKRYVTEDASWTDLQSILQSRTLNLEDALELSTKQKQELTNVVRSFGRKFHEEIARTSKEKRAEAQPDKMADFVKMVAEIADRKIGNEAGIEISEILVPIQTQRFAVLMIRQQLQGVYFYHAVPRKRLLKMLNVDAAVADELGSAAAKALIKREEAIRNRKADNQIEVVNQLPQQQQRLFNEHFGKYLK